MKKNTVKIFIAALAFAGCASTYAQADKGREAVKKATNHEELMKISAELGDKARKDREEALRLAPLKGWPVIINGEDGNVSELVGVRDNGTPIYFTTYNVGAAITSKVNKLHNNGGLGLNLEGQGMVMGIWDQNHPRFSHNTFKNTSGQTRVVLLDNSASAISFHSTHVLGTMVGTGAGSESTAKGMAPKATGYAANWINDSSEMAFAASEYGIVISNHSYGTGAAQVGEYEFGAYTSRSRDIDNIAFNAPYYLTVHAAGNDRNNTPPINSSKGGYDLINGTKTSKNSLVVAAVNEVLNYTGPSSVGMSSFSSFGPTDDNRVKPDISAKGVNVFSASNASDSSYGNSNGTSMASPVVAGGALLLQQHYLNLYGDFMYAATLRGLICHTADEAGPWDGPDPMFGWGLFNAEKAVMALSNEGSTSRIDQFTLAQGQTYTTTVQALGGQQLQASICWTDRPGGINSGIVDLATPVLVNDLDIRITQNGTDYHPWNLGATPTSSAVRGVNNVDNIERIDISNPSGVYTVTVTHKGNLQGGSQDYSMIITGINENLGTADLSAGTFSVWPNPANDRINLKFSADVESNATADLYDIQGRLVLSHKLSSADNALDVSNIASGMYVIVVKNGAGTESRKIIIN